MINILNYAVGNLISSKCGSNRCFIILVLKDGHRRIESFLETPFFQMPVGVSACISLKVDAGS